MTRTISKGSRSASPTTTASRTRKPASSTNLGPSAVGIVGRLIPGGRLRLRLQLDAQLVELLRRDLAWPPTHRIDTGLVLRECDDVAEVGLAGQEHHRSVDAGGDSSVRWSPHR